MDDKGLDLVVKRILKIHEVDSGHRGDNMMCDLGRMFDRDHIPIIERSAVREMDWRLPEDDDPREVQLALFPVDEDVDLMEDEVVSDSNINGTGLRVKDFKG